MALLLRHQVNINSFSFKNTLRDCKYSYMCPAVEETNIEATLAVMNTTELVVEVRPEKNSGP